MTQQLRDRNRPGSNWQSEESSFRPKAATADLSRNLGEGGKDFHPNGKMPVRQGITAA